MMMRVHKRQVYITYNADLYTIQTKEVGVVRKYG